MSRLVGRIENRVDVLRARNCTGQAIALAIALTGPAVPRRVITPGGRPAHHRGRHAQIGLESRNDLPRDAEPDGLLDRIEPFMLLGAHQRDRLTARPGPAVAADAMDVICGQSGQLEIHYL